jgi:hypothetical protein
VKSNSSVLLIPKNFVVLAMMGMANTFSGEISTAKNGNIIPKPIISAKALTPDKPKTKIN